MHKCIIIIIIMDWLWLAQGRQRPPSFVALAWHCCCCCSRRRNTHYANRVEVETQHCLTLIPEEKKSFATCIALETLETSETLEMLEILVGEDTQIMEIWQQWKQKFWIANRNRNRYFVWQSDQRLWLAWQCRRRRRAYANVAAVEENKSCAIAREKSFHRRGFHKKFNMKYVATIRALRVYWVGFSFVSCLQLHWYYI